MALAYVKDTGKTLITDGGQTATCSFGTLPSAGALIVLVVQAWHVGGIAMSSVTDNQGNTYTQRVQSAAGSGAECRSWIYSAENIGTPSGTFTITVTWTTTSGHYGALIASEVSGAVTSGATDQTISAASDSTTADAATGNTSTTTQADEIVFAGMQLIAQDSAATISVPTTGYTQILVEQDALNNNGYEVAYKIVAATGVQSATWTHDNTAQTGWSCALATFKDAGAAPTGHPTWKRWGGVPFVGGTRGVGRIW